MDIREKIKACKDFSAEMVSCPEWGMDIEIRTMRGVDRARMLKLSVVDGQQDPEKFQPYLIVMSCYDPATGERIFTDEDIEWILSKSVLVLDRIATVAMRVNGLDKKSLEAAEKNS